MGAPAYQNGGDDQGGVEETVGRVGGIEAAVHAEAVCHVPLANLRRPRRKGWGERAGGGAGSWRPGPVGAGAKRVGPLPQVSHRSGEMQPGLHSQGANLG